MKQDTLKDAINSIDEIIKLESQKLELLKLHKKGLLQLLQETKVS